MPPEPEIEPADEPPPSKPRAMQTYAAGLRYLNDRTVGALLQARELFEFAYDQDPTFSSALSKLADCTFLLGTAPYATLDPPEAFPRAADLATRSLLLRGISASDIASAKTTLAAIQMLHDWDWDRAEDAFVEITTQHPTYPRARQFYAHLLLCTRRRTEAQRAIFRATTDAAASPIILMTEGLIQYFSGSFDPAYKTFAHTARIHNGFSPAHLWVGVLAEHFGRNDEAVTALERSLSIETLPHALACLGYLYARKEDDVMLRNTLDRLEALKEQRRVSPWFLALIHAGSGDSENTREYLEAAAEERCDFLIHLAIDPRFERFQTKTWFADIVREIFKKSTRPI